jgi:F0F1-type ATP synthase epsilon subunit
MTKIQDFLMEDQATDEGSQKVVVDGILDAQASHSACIKAKYEAIKKAEADRIEAKKQNELRKKQRREAREKRAKDQAREKFRDEVERHVVFKGEVCDVLKTNLADVHGAY